MKKYRLWEWDNDIKEWVSRFTTDDWDEAYVWSETDPYNRWMLHSNVLPTD